jgi:hypothetical protein
MDSKFTQSFRIAEISWIIFRESDVRALPEKNRRSQTVIDGNISE